MSNINFVIYDGIGNIVQCGSCPEETLSLQTHPEGSDVLAGIGTCDKHYVINGVIAAYTDIELQSKNNLEAGFVWKMPERVAIDSRAIADARIQCWEKIKGIREIKENTPFLCNGSLYDVNKLNIAGAVQMASIAKATNSAFSIDWVLHDNTIKTLNADEMIAVGISLGEIVSNTYNISNTLRASINSPNITIYQLDALTWPT